MIYTREGETFGTPQDYVAHSKHWREFRDFIRKERGFACEVCGSDDRVHLHHDTYKNVGFEDESDVRLLGAICHQDAHDAIDEIRGNDKVQSASVPLHRSHRIPEPAVYIPSEWW